MSYISENELLFANTMEHGQIEHVNLKVVDSAGNATQFKIKTHTALKKLMATYCERSGLDMQTVRFIIYFLFTYLFFIYPILYLLLILGLLLMEEE